jgi:hypothetical protein
LGDVVRIKFLGLFFAVVLLGPAKAMEAVPATTSPTMQDMVKWKSDVLSKYDEIIYLDSDAKPISENDFFARVVAEKRGFNMRTNPETPKRITIRLLNDVEQRTAQAGIK